MRDDSALAQQGAQSGQPVREVAGGAAGAADAEVDAARVEEASTPNTSATFAGS